MPLKVGGFQEIWVEYGEKRLCALINGDRGWLMYLQGEGDSGFSSRNPAYDGPADAMIEYEIENGQDDKFPASWAYPIEDVERALAYFRRTGDRAPFIQWHRD